jgi:hypothetical protein
LVKKLRSVILLLVLSCIGGAAAKADTLHYDLTGPYGFQLQFSLPQDPSYTSMSSGYVVPVTGLTVYSTPVTNLDFFKSANGGGLGGDGYQLTGSQLYTLTGSTLVLSKGTFTLEGYGSPFTLTVTSSPEPSTLLLLAMGIAALVLATSRKPVVN